MSASRSDGLAIKNYLEQLFILTSLEWIEACIEFIKQENNRSVLLQSLKNLVYQQWLEADLEEIGVSSLPRNLTTTSKTILNGCFALQVDGIRDISRPAYAQLKELDRNINSNAEFSAAPAASIPPWEAKPTRMLMLNLTDGCSHIQGMEYKPITSLSPNLPPGVKVLIQGPVDCRFGVLLLTAEKIKILGGEVESKLTPFSRKALIRQSLQLPAETDPVSDSTVLDPSSTDSNINGFISNSTIALPQNNNTQLLQSTRCLNSYSDTIQRQDRRTANPGATNSDHDLGEDVFENQDDDFVESLDYSVLDEIEKDSLNKSESFDAVPKDEDVWQEDEEMMQEMMAFQDEDPGFQMPDMPTDHKQTKQSSNSDVEKRHSFTDLSSILRHSPTNSTITIKGFIMKVLSKLECTIDHGWSLLVKIGDGTASLDVQVHDKVLEDIMGVSASEMRKMQLEGSTDSVKAEKVKETISRFKIKLKDYNCIMEVKFAPNLKPCVVKCYPINQLAASHFERGRPS